VAHRIVVIVLDRSPIGDHGHVRAMLNMSVAADRSVVVTRQRILAANPRLRDARRLVEKIAPHRDAFDFVSRWATSVDELMREVSEPARR
jgi:hypothetical protein